MGEFTWDFSLVFAAWPAILRGTVLTMALSIACLLIGAVIALAVAMARISSSKSLQILGRAYVEVFRNIPSLIQLIWLYYAVPVIVGFQLSPTVAAIIGISLNTSAYLAEIYRGGIESVVQGQWEGSKALGMSHAQTLRRVIFPQVFQRMLPALTNRGVEVIKVTSLASVISVTELTYQGRLISASYFRPMEALTTVAVVYLLMIYPLSFLSSRLERHLGRKH